MQINNIDCLRPKQRINSFKGNSEKSEPKRMRYKHFEQMSDDVLEARSIVKAYHEVKNNPKGQLLNAMPEITTSLVLTSLALTQPGKLSAKAAAGLGFLALYKSINSSYNAASKVVDKKYKNEEPTEANEKSKTLLKLGTFVATSAIVATGAVLGAKAGKKLLNSEKLAPLGDFVKKESNTLANEINGTKLGKLVENKMIPFTQKHPKLANALSFGLPLASLAGGIIGHAKLLKSVSEDIKQKAENNFIKGKIIQAKAREDFDKIDAVEV